MVKMNRYILLLTCLAGLQCSKNSATDNDKTPPVISITSPVNNQVFSSGQTMNVTGAVTDNDYIAEIHIHIYNNNTGAKLLDEHIYPGSNTASLSRSIVVSSGINYKIDVIAVDKAVNETRQTVFASCN